mgnify:FL=1
MGKNPEREKDFDASGRTLSIEYCCEVDKLQKRILIALCLVLLCASFASAQGTRLGLAMGGGVGWLRWDQAFVGSLEAANFSTPTFNYNFYGGSEFRFNEKWLLRNLGQGIVATAQDETHESKLAVGMWTVAAMRLWEIKPNLEVGVGAMAGLGTFSLRLDYGEKPDLDPNLRELTSRVFMPVAPVVTARYSVGVQTFTIEALYLVPQFLDQDLKSGLQVQFGLSYDLGY